MKNKWIWVVSIVLLSGILVLTMRRCNGANSLGVGDKLNAQGIRDDVAAAIQKTFPKSERVRAAAIQLARTTQLAIDNPENALEINKLDEAATACYYAIRGDVIENENTSVPLKVEAMVVNSYQRNRAYIRYNSKLSGRIFESIRPDFSLCEFDVGSMSN
jgi:hypothetical protein